MARFIDEDELEQEAPKSAPKEVPEDGPQPVQEEVNGRKRLGKRSPATKRLKRNKIIGSNGVAGPTANDQRKRLTIVSGVCAALAVGGLGLGAYQTAQARYYIDNYESNLVELVCVQSNVKAGDAIDSANLTVTKVPKQFAPADGCTASQASQIVGHRAVTNLTAGNPISLSCIQASPIASNITKAPDEGKIAYMVSLDATSSMSPLLHVGDKVNVLTGTQGSGSSVFAEGVKILALDSNMSSASQSEQNGYSTVTLELTEAQASDLYTLTNINGGSIKLIAPPEVDQNGNVTTGAWGTGSEAAPATYKDAATTSTN